MKILCISDTHDILPHLEYALKKGKEKHGCTAVIHAGDLVIPATLDTLMSSGLPTYYVMGNNEEGYEEELAAKSKKLGTHFFLDLAQFTLGGRNIAVTHYPYVAQRLSMFPEFDLICCGHSHTPRITKLPSGTIVLNTGNLAGWRHKATYAVYDTETHTATTYPLEFRKTHYSFPEE